MGKGVTHLIYTLLTCQQRGRAAELIGSWSGEQTHTGLDFARHVPVPLVNLTGLEAKV